MANEIQEFGPRVEKHYFQAKVRKHGAIGVFYTQNFAVFVTVLGGHKQLIEEAICGINAQGYEVHHIINHASQKECL